MHLSVATKKRVYVAVVFSTLLYGAETWTVKAAHLRRMNTFHFDSVHTILSETRSSQWAKRLSNSSLAARFGLGSDVADLLRKHRLRWLGHLARMDLSRLPKQMLFAELPSTRPQHGPKKRWRDIATENIQQLDLAATGD